jgi:uncharacterized protein YggT (Ycf19 family)
MEPNRSNPVAEDETRRLTHYEAVKSRLEDDVHARIAEEALGASAAERAEAKAVAASLKHRAAVEVVESETELARGRRATRFSQFVDYAFGVVYGLIGLEFMLELLGARQSSGFKHFLDSVTAPLLGPFRGLIWDPSVGSLELRLSYLVAFVVYVMLHMATNGLLRLFVKRKSAL